MAVKLLLAAKPVNMGVIKDTNHSNINQKMMQQMLRKFSGAAAKQAMWRSKQKTLAMMWYVEGIKFRTMLK